MLTPPSAHRQQVLRCASERDREREAASDRRENELRARLAQEKARVVDERRQQISVARRERDSYIANVRSLLNMSPSDSSRGGVVPARSKPAAVSSSSSSAAQSRSQAQCGPIAGSILVSRHTNPAKNSKVGAAGQKAAVWSEVSTAAPSTAGGDDFDDGRESSPGEDDRPPRCRNQYDRPKENCNSELLQSLDLQVGSCLRRSIEEWIRRQDASEIQVDEDPYVEHKEDQEEEVLDWHPAHEVEDAPQQLQHKNAAERPNRKASPIRTRAAFDGRDSLHCALADSLEDLAGALRSAKSAAAVPQRKRTPSPPIAFVPPHRQAVGQQPDAGMAKAEPPAWLVRVEAEADAKAAKAESPPTVRPNGSVRRHPSAPAPSGRSTASSSVAGAASAPNRATQSRKSAGAIKPVVASSHAADVTAVPERSRNSAAAAAVATKPLPATAKAAARAAAVLRKLTPEEEALERSLLRLDFHEMRRQFSGKEPLWRKEALDESFKANSFVSATKKEEKLKASLDRLGSALANLQERGEARQRCASARNARLSDEVSQSGVPLLRAPSSTHARANLAAAGNAGRRRRPQSAVGYSRRGPAAPPLPSGSVQSLSSTPVAASEGVATPSQARMSRDLRSAGGGGRIISARSAGCGTPVHESA
eukprot:gnl/TRDRNA2_/TRDRNA2_173441_c1_seq1.p1 gnl/TRDRNA2_/TRDRNA2_173441_c1~~gnl/TRDRNA2_/TRDRNA2_173441_c1_seq1.p1  ORF type:complete len:650 (+),score=127.35 gnl/TRDRNA2_/TRDRNA2_173441_c1_seq1:59-2008(+)